MKTNKNKTKIVIKNKSNGKIFFSLSKMLLNFQIFPYCSKAVPWVLISIGNVPTSADPGFWGI